MKDEIKKFGEIIKEAERILVTTHKGPDPDAWSSLSLVVIGLERYLKKKNVSKVIFGTPSNSQLESRFEELNKTKLSAQNREIDLGDYDLVIMTDAHEIELCIPNFKNLEGKAIVAIDHHEENAAAVGKLALNFNNLHSSAAEEVYSVFSELIGEQYRTDTEVAELVQQGIISDTNQFLYPIVKPSTYETMSELVKIKQLDIEKYMLELRSLSVGAIKVIQLLLSSHTIEGNAAYMSVNRKDIIELGLDENDRNGGRLFLLHNFLRNIVGIEWGFIIRESLDQPGEWRVSLRADKDTVGVEGVAKLLDGGGHKYAAGASVTAKDENEAIEKILSAAKETNLLR